MIHLFSANCTVQFNRFKKKVPKEFQISVNQLEAATINQFREVYYLAIEVNSLT